MRKFVEQFEKTIGSSPIVLSSQIEKHFGPAGDTLYLRGRLQFIDGSVLEIALFASESSYGIVFDKYRYQYMDRAGQMFFRYDNAPHHTSLTSFPHHKHTPVNVSPSSMPTIKDILNEVSAIILRSQP